MTNFTRFNHKPLINPGYKDIGVDLKNIPFRKASDLYHMLPELVYTIKAMYRSTSDYGDQIVVIVEPGKTPEPNHDIAATYLFLDSPFRMALPRKYAEIINVDDAGLIDDCNKGLARFRITQYHSKRFNKELNDVEFL